MLRTIHVCPQCERAFSSGAHGHDHIGCRPAALTRPWTAVQVVEADPVREVLEDAQLVDDPDGYYGYLVSPTIIDKLREVTNAGT